ncbi:hypothetical protein BLA29_009346 [Euroglyphus maynei]|uniref:Uncharacterized protein n=1 Tax=Euroglyphus maynei TaxID=6958 RepID=A0A1Y3B7Z9_EURMA|nr:hypothetical protein BLA29_009346 [Euroglyphus maynei]
MKNSSSICHTKTIHCIIIWLRMESSNKLKTVTIQMFNFNIIKISINNNNNPAINMLKRRPPCLCH